MTSTGSFCLAPMKPQESYRRKRRERRGRANPVPQRVEAGRIQDGSADSRVRAFLAPDQVRADTAVRAPASPFLESALRSRTLPIAGRRENLVSCYGYYLTRP